MLKEIFANVNWIDVAMAAIVLRCLFMGYSTGFAVELFKTFGMVVATFVTLHYYVAFADFLQEKIVAHSSYNEFVAFVLLWGAVTLVFKFIRDGILLLMKVEVYSFTDRCVGAVIGVVRAVLICGLVFSLLVISGNKNTIKSAKKSFFGFYLVDFSPRVYGGIFDGLVIKFFPQEQKNEEVVKLLENTTTSKAEK